MVSMSLKKYLETIEDLSNHKIAITGATSGIGLALTRHLAKKGAKVVLLARNPQKAKQVQDELKECVIDIVEYDQSSFNSLLAASTGVSPLSINPAGKL